ncbi:hypothetical protein ACFUR9_37085, partial [Streptomyces cinereoruber]
DQQAHRLPARRSNDPGTAIEHITCLDHVDRFRLRHLGPDHRHHPPARHPLKHRHHHGQTRLEPDHTADGSLNLTTPGFGITKGPVFRHLLTNGVPASAETRAKIATKNGERSRPRLVGERVKYWFSKAGLVSDGRPISSHSLRAGAATNLGETGATYEEFEEASRWAKASPIPRTV